MKKFNFSLDKVLNFTLFKEEQQKMVVLKINNDLARERDILDQLNKDCLQLKLDLNAKCARKVTVSELITYSSYLNYLEKRIKATEATIAKLEEKLDSERQKLSQLTKERKILDKLKEKKYLEFWNQFLKEEQALLDEIALNSAVRNHGMGR